jgi:protein-S-isoprenylcysteine O-methyltransferase Ste14
MTSFLVFAGLSILLAAISWRSLRARGSHGFYRFFAWEAILGLIVINIPYWFKDPFSWHQVLSWFFLTVSLVPLPLGIYGLRARGKPSREREGDLSLLAFEKTTSLVTTGIYRYIRHPLYSSLLLLTWGVLFKSLSWITIPLGIAATGFLAATAWADERECIAFFGEEYRVYMQNTKMFIPFII